MAMRSTISTPLFVILGIASCLSFLGGCKKSAADAEATVVAVMEIDLNPDGSISDSGMQKIEAHANAPKLTLAFFRSRLTDAGLIQLAKFPNLRRVEATGSRITPEGIEKLKSALPEVEVVR